MTVITVSRQLGSHGEEVAAQVAQALNLRLIDAQTINKAAQKAGVPSIALAEMEQEGKRGLANQVLKALRAMPNLGSAAAYASTTGDEVGISYPELKSPAYPLSGLFSPTVPPISASLEGYVRMVDLVIRGLAREGNVLIFGRGGQVLLRHHPGALHLQVVAPRAYRVRTIVERLDLDQRSAQNRLRASDRARADYVRRYHDANWLDPTLYHLTINTGRIPIASAVELIIVAHKAITAATRQDSDHE
ncbi:MAG: cytidylate kinase-like family protein [Anaerolineae bacterium]|jgi:cytidylate kinase